MSARTVLKTQNFKVSDDKSSITLTLKEGGEYKSNLLYDTQHNEFYFEYKGKEISVPITCNPSQCCKNTNDEKKTETVVKPKGEKREVTFYSSEEYSVFPGFDELGIKVTLKSGKTVTYPLKKYNSHLYCFEHQGRTVVVDWFM
jgi:hypothetical protein